MTKRSNQQQATPNEGDLEDLLEIVGMDGLDGDETAPGGGDESIAGQLDRDEVVARLKACGHRLQRKHVFEVGQLVQWKKGLRNKRIPDYGQPMIVIEVLKEPVVDLEQGAGSPYFRDPLTVVLGVIDKDGDFITFHFDGRRFEPYATEV